MMILLAVLLVGLVLAAAFGKLADTRDADFSLGKVLHTPHAPTR